MLTIITGAATISLLMYFAIEALHDFFDDID